MPEIDDSRADESSLNSSAPAFTAATQPSYAHTLFLGPGGLRPGWGIAFYFLMYYGLQRLVGLWSDSWKLGELRSMMTDEFFSVLAALIPSLILARVEQRSWKRYGLPVRQAFGKLFWVGAVWGFAGITILIGSQYELHAFDFGHVVLHGIKMAKFAAFWMLMFLLVGFFEEFLLRGYSQFTLTRGLGFWPAAVVLSSVFGLIHLWNGGEEWPGLLAAAAIGFFFCLTLRRTGSLWFAVGFHAAWDWGETFFYSVPDSGTVFPGHLLSSSFHGPHWLTGGSVGPEGSVLCFVVIAVLWLAFDRTYREAKYFPAETNLEQA
jgi:CAAX protease family protein